MTSGRHRIVVVGDGALPELQGVADAVICRDVLSSVFDDDTDTWELRSAGGASYRAEIVVACQPAHVPWVPDMAGRNDFRGESFHAAAWDPGFDPAGKRIALVGTDSAAAHHLGRLIQLAASVTVFAHPPRRVVADMPLWPTRSKRWLLRHIRPSAQRPSVANSAIEAVTSSGVRTTDGVDHPLDAIIYGTGLAIPDRISDDALVGSGAVTIRQAWYDGMEPFLGVAVCGFPNYFFITGPDTGAQARYIAECLKIMKRTTSSRIEVRRSSQQVFNERAQLEPAQPPPVASAFDLSSCAPEHDDIYDGAATLTINGSCHRVRVRLTGHLDPIDGHYHWRGTVFSLPSQPLPAAEFKQARTVTLTVDERSVPARIIEQTPWGTHSIAGTGAPPYALSAL